MKEIKSEAIKVLEDIRLKALKSTNELPLEAFSNFEEIENFCKENKVDLIFKKDKLVKM